MAQNGDGFLEIRNITKRFGVVTALKDVTFGAAPGEIHTLLGENGAGKSTLVKIIKGELWPDAGSIALGGKTIEQFTPQYAHNLGISMVHQELAVFENMTVAENIFPLSTFRTRLGTVDRAAQRRSAEESLKLFDLCIDPGERMENLSLAEQQVVEILRAISLKQKVILLDEPTSGLRSDETTRLMAILKKLRDGGITILYISHRIQEVLDLSDRITVLRDGRYVGTFENNAQLSSDQLISTMVGHEYSAALYAQRERAEGAARLAFLEVRGLSKRKSAQNVSFTLHQGEILGFFGLEGSGTNEVSRMVFGLESKETGEISVEGKAVPRVAPDSMIERGVMYVNNDRKRAGLLMNMPATDNLAIPILARMSRAGFINFAALRAHAQKLVQRFSIILPSVRAKPRQLSGGNQQKLMMSICLGTEPKCLIVNEPTRGIDVGAKAEIHAFLLGMAKEGTSILVFSSEIPELISLSERVIVMKNKAVAGELAGATITEKALMRLAAGGGERRGDCNE